MTDDNVIKHNQELTAAPPKGEARLLRALVRRVGRSEATSTTPLTSGELQHMSLPAADGSQPKWLPVGRTRTRQCEKTKVVHMRETNHGRVGVTHTGVLGDGRASIRPGCGVGTTFTGDPSRSPADVGRGRAAGVTLVGDPSRGRLTGRAPGVALTGELSRGQSDNGFGREPQPTLTGDSVSLAGAWGRGLPDRWHGRGTELVFTGDPGRGLADVVHGRGIRIVLTDDSSRGHAKNNGNGRGSGFVHLGDLDRGLSFASTHDRVLGPGDAPTGGPTGAPGRGRASTPHDRALGDAPTSASSRGRALATGHGRGSGVTLLGGSSGRGNVVDTGHGRGGGIT